MGERFDSFQDGGLRTEGIAGFTFVAGSAGETASSLFQGRPFREGGGDLEEPFGPFRKKVFHLFHPPSLFEIVEVQFLKGDQMGVSGSLSRVEMREDR